VTETLVQINKINNNEELNIWSLYLYAMKSPVTRQKISKKVREILWLSTIKRNTI